eukprot:92189_1
MAQQDYKMHETTKLLHPITDRNMNQPLLNVNPVSIMSYPSHSLTLLLSTPWSQPNALADHSIFSQLILSTKFKNIMIYTRLAIVFFILLFVICIIGIILYFVPITHLWISFAVCIIFTFFGSVLGMKLTYDWFYMGQQTLTDLKNEISNMEEEKERLVKLKHDIKYNVRDLQTTVLRLNHSAADLEERVKDYDHLSIQLQETAVKCGSIQHVLDDLLSIMNGMQFVQTENRKATILAKYYDAAFKDQSGGLRKAKGSYERFIGRLDSNCRRILESLGGFDKYDSDRNGIIEIKEFMFLLEEVMMELEEQDLNQINKKT